MSDPVRCRVGDTVRCGRALVVSVPVDPAALARAVRGERNSDARVAVVADEPGPAHEHVGCIRPAMGLRTQTALAAAARSRGIETRHDAALAGAREKLAALESPGETGTDQTDTGTADERAQYREAAAAAATETERLRETVAAARGRLQARREQGLDPTPAAEELAAAVERLSEAETEAAAARQRLDIVRERTRESRDAREQRFRLEERVANLERQARARRREQVHEEYLAALEVVPGVGDVAESSGDNVTDSREMEPVVQALAVARIAELSAPVVLACERFESVETAANWLDTAVIRLTSPV